MAGEKIAKFFIIRIIITFLIDILIPCLILIWLYVSKKQKEIHILNFFLNSLQTQKVLACTKKGLDLRGEDKKIINGLSQTKLSATFTFQFKITYHHF
jgi:hypothetical protein